MLGTVNGLADIHVAAALAANKDMIDGLILERKKLLSSEVMKDGLMEIAYNKGFLKGNELRRYKQKIIKRDLLEIAKKLNINFCLLAT